MKKNVGLTYGDFEFPSEQGFTGSRGKSSVKGYKRGGTVKKMAGGFMGPEREITVDDVTISTPRAKGGRVGGMHGKLKRAGAKMGYKYGGQVKDTSGEFKEKRGKQDTMDDGVQPARRGKNARNEQEREAGGTGRMTPGLKKGGKVKKGIKGVASSGGGALADAALRHAKKVLRPSKDLKAPKRAGTAASRKGMPKNVKAAGGTVHKAVGGAVKAGVGKLCSSMGYQKPSRSKKASRPTGVKGGKGVKKGGTEKYARGGTVKK